MIYLEMNITESPLILLKKMQKDFQTIGLENLN